MAPPAKKQKTDSNKPIIFKSPGTKPDLYFKVFSQEFHVNSVVLKLNSEYFRTFLDPSGGKLPKSSSPLFTSEWFTKVDGKGSWELSSDHACRNFSLKDNCRIFEGDTKREEQVFEKFLCALFQRQYQITDASELSVLTDMARYYTALPAVAPSVYAAVLNSPTFPASMIKDPAWVLALAKTLRNNLLFKDSLILVLGPWSNPDYLKLSDPDLVRIGEAAHQVVCKKIVQVQQAMHSILAQYKNKGHGSHNSELSVDLEKKLSNIASSCYDVVGGMDMANTCYDVVGGMDIANTCYNVVGGMYQGSFHSILPQYYRKCSEITITPRAGVQANAIQEATAPLLKNMLRINHNIVAGEGEFKDYFLCFELPDSLLPWDPTQDEWYI